MKVEEIIYSILFADVNINNIVGNNIFPIRAAQGKNLPFITYTVTSIEPNAGKREVSAFDTYMIDIDIFSATFSQLISLVDSVRENFEAVNFESDGVGVEFDFLNIKEDYKNDAQLFNKTVSIIGHYYSV
ncbi:DUF3168 domain-containing protein [Algoriphagus sp. D3-2-R+10]|uniref:tail completion protein gp17 n=1 Tax=Algoriphagus aurantiacus TaxID=3103948 RepID=UPI002B3F3484|nr:DUF3168 domain-containing protein [Algoriphagus sp. D3-2-R+10]MEB2775231.1 DUF3168 domain-containing protein [Algoriphagus sp. D3-2-R+10]